MMSRRHAVDVLNSIAAAAAAITSVVTLAIPDVIRAPIQFRADIYGITLATLALVVPLLVFATVFSARRPASARIVSVGGVSWLLSAHVTLLTGTQIGSISILYALVFGASLGALLIGIRLSQTETAIGEAARTPFALALALSSSLVLGIWLLDSVWPADASIHIVLFGLAALLVWRRAALGAAVSSIAVVMTGVCGASEIARIVYLWQKGVPPTWIALVVPTALIATAIGCGVMMVRALGDDTRT